VSYTILIDSWVIFATEKLRKLCPASFFNGTLLAYNKMAHRPRLKANSHRWDCHGNKKARK
jgi:hypothetical protein